MADSSASLKIVLVPFHVYFQMYFLIKSQYFFYCLKGKNRIVVLFFYPLLQFIFLEYSQQSQIFRQLT